MLDATLQNVVDAKVALQPTEAGAGSADARYALPVRTLKPGGYVLRVSADGTPASTKDVRFTVR